MRGQASRLRAIPTVVVVDGLAGKEYRIPTDLERQVAADAEGQLQATFLADPAWLCRRAHTRWRREWCIACLFGSEVWDAAVARPIHCATAVLAWPPRHRYTGCDSALPQPGVSRRLGRGGPRISIVLARPPGGPVDDRVHVVHSGRKRQTHIRPVRAPNHVGLR